MKSDNSNLKHLFKDSLPKILYCDTSFFVSAILTYENKKYEHRNAVKFAERLKDSDTSIIFSKYMFIEFWSAVFSQRMEEKLGKSYRENLKQKPEIAKAHFEWVKQRMKLLDDLLSLFQNRIGIITFFKDAHIETQKFAEKYCLDIYDAIHALTMERVKVKDVVSFDRHFRNLHRYNFNVWCRYPTGDFS